LISFVKEINTRRRSRVERLKQALAPAKKYESRFFLLLYFTFVLLPM
jgi:hypothetical protein